MMKFKRFKNSKITFKKGVAYYTIYNGHTKIRCQKKVSSLTDAKKEIKKEVHEMNRRIFLEEKEKDKRELFSTKF